MSEGDCAPSNYKYSTFRANGPLSFPPNFLVIDKANEWDRCNNQIEIVSEIKYN